MFFSRKPTNVPYPVRECITASSDEQVSHLCLLHLIFPQTAQLWPRGNSSCWYDYKAKYINQFIWETSCRCCVVQQFWTDLPLLLVWWSQRCLEAEIRDPGSSRRWPLQPGRTKTPLWCGYICRNIPKYASKYFLRKLTMGICVRVRARARVWRTCLKAQ